MEPNPFLGVVLHAIGGLAAASFYLPYKQVKGWAWENYWILGGFFSWIVTPLIVSLLIIPNSFDIISQAPLSTLFWTWFFGVLWGIGGLTFGLTMRYLGIALGYAIALGLCAAFGTLVPPLFRGEFTSVLQTVSGRVILLGVFVCLFGITLSGKAGMNKEKELSDEQKKEKVQEFNFLKGLIVALFAGAMSASMSYGLAAGKPIAAIAIENGAPNLWQTLPVLAVVLLGGFTTNVIWCMYLILRKGTLKDYFRSTYGSEKISLAKNYLFCIFAGVLWYLQFFFYGMGTTKMGKYDFSSWTLHMASIIIFSTLWGIALKEWKGTSRRTHLWIALGLTILILSTIIVGYGNKLALLD